MSFELRVLGSSPAWPSPGRACTGYLLSIGPSTVLMDCGTGVFERLRLVLPPEDVGSILVSHLHFDHWVDLIPYRYYLRYEARAPQGPELLLPPEATEMLRAALVPVDDDPEFFTGTFVTTEYAPAAGAKVRGAEVSFHRTRHPIATYAIRLEAEGKVLVYSADTGWDAGLAEFARGADLFLCEAALGAAGGAGDVHLDARQAGRLATEAGVKRLLLTHVSEAMAAEAVEAARSQYAGPVEHAAEGRVLAL